MKRYRVERGPLLTLAMAGATDQEIARAFSCTSQSIQKARRRYNVSSLAAGRRVMAHEAERKARVAVALAKAAKMINREACND